MKAGLGGRGIMAAPGVRTLDLRNALVSNANRGALRIRRDERPLRGLCIRTIRTNHIPLAGG
jgi:hypothetical protein